MTTARDVIDRCPKCGAPIAGDIVRITRAQHEALMAAAKALDRLYVDGAYSQAPWNETIDALAALRAAGILEGE